MSQPGRRVRGRWLAAGLALGLTVGGAVAFVGAAGGQVPSVFSPITPCRLMDTRPGSTVGPRNAPLGANETYAAQVTGVNGQCTIPADATAVVMNVTSVDPTAVGYLTLFPAGAVRPTASNLNVRPGQAPTPNLVTVSLSAAGALAVYNAAGTVDVIADIAGYYTAESGPAGAIPGPPGDPDRLSDQQIALLQWGRKDFATGTEPTGVAYDGTYVWVTNATADTVSRIDRVTGARDDFATGSHPEGIAFDGTSIWVTNLYADTVSKIDRITGARSDFPVGDTPADIAFDGSNIWVTNRAADTVSRLSVASGSRTDYATGDIPGGIVFDGVSIWVANAGSDTVSKIKPSTGARTDYPAGLQPGDLAFDGQFLWVTNPAVDTVTRLDRNSGTITAYPTGDEPRGVLFDGTSIWVTNHWSNTVSQFDLATGARTDHATAAGPQGLAFDGANVWVANYSVHTVSRIVP